MGFGSSRRWRAAIFVLALLCSLRGERAYGREDDVCISPIFPHRGALTADTLTRLIDIPGNDYANIAADVAMAVSPNGRHVAFQLQQADPVGDSYCLSWYVLALTHGAQPQFRGDGGAHQFRPANGLASGRRGLLKAVRPRWSPDSSWFAYVRRDSSGVQIWRSWVGARAAQRLTRSADPVRDFAIAADGRAIVFETGAGDDDDTARTADEDRNGYFVDRRFSLITQASPLRPPAPAPARYWRLDLISASITPASGAERDMLRAAHDAENPLAPRPTSAGRFWFEKADPARQGYAAPRAPAFAPAGGGPIVRCTLPGCSGAVHGAWTRGAELFFIGAAGINAGERALYAWNPHANRLRLVLRSTAQWIGCAPAGADAICLQEDTSQPRRIVRVDLDRGDVAPLFDPNPDFARAAQADSQRLSWSTPEGGGAFGDLLLPKQRTPGARLPLVVVQYRSRGFLRGGVGDEYPIWLYLAHGFAVLSVDVADEWWQSAAQTEADPGAITRHIWREHKRISFVSLLEGLKAVEKLGVIDPARIGITGMSNGADTLAYGLVHSSVFAAAISSGGMWDPATFYLFDDATQKRLQSYGLPAPDSAEHLAQWRWISPALNAGAIDTPLMINAADREILFSASTAAALRLNAKPVALYVYPDETHDKWRPAHRLALYRRNVDWMAFWLRGDETGIAPIDLERWRALRAARHPSPPSGE